VKNRCIYARPANNDSRLYYILLNMISNTRAKGLSVDGTVYNIDKFVKIKTTTIHPTAVSIRYTISHDIIIGVY